MTATGEAVSGGGLTVQTAGGSLVGAAEAVLASARAAGVAVALAGKDATLWGPEATLQAVADHGVVRGDTVTSSYAGAQQVLDDLKAAGIDYDDVVQQLEEEGVSKFEDAWNDLIASVTDQLEKAGAEIMPSGAAKPAGDGPAAASPEATAR